MIRNFRVAALAMPMLLVGCLYPYFPTADAGADQSATEGAVVHLKGSGTDVDGKVVDYQWRQVSGPTVKLSNANKKNAKFTAPDVEIQTSLEFELVVKDNYGAPSEPDTVTVLVDQIKFFGTAPGGPEDYEHLLTYFDQITPENAGKWGSVEGTRDTMNWTALDTAYQTAVANNLKFKFHTLLWGQQQPGWLTGLPAAEQLEEIEEWMAAVAARYPDLEYVEVLNEPLNAPPPYREALGGAGTTGFDWVIKSFELARKHFPKARLILNEYNVIVENGITTNYLNIINLLNERKLIDGVGEQAHFYERANPEVLLGNLDRLTATGLPVYISEFDLNLANDADQANVMSKLFPIFWDHPGVAGVTHWGHQQGSMWRANAFLVRTDGTTRPAMDWVQCYIGGGGDACTVPEFVHPGWVGDQNGVTLDAVNHDEGSGVVSGGVIAYTDDGDWIKFKGVQFRSDWNKVWVAYAKGNTTQGSISVHLDSLDSPAAVTVNLPPTAGWGSSATVEEALASISGTHDVFIRFNGGPGVANLSSVRFGKPIPPSTTNLLNNGGFEAGIAGWSNWGSGSLSVSTAQAHGGTQSLLSTGRTGTGGFAAYNLTSLVQRGTTYAVGAWLLHTGAANTTGRLAAKVECTVATTPAGHNTYPWLQNNGAVAPNTWTQLAGNLVIPNCDLVEVSIYFEGTAAGVDVYLDDIRVVPPNNNLVNDGGFETGIAGWSSWNGSMLSASGLQKRNGAQSLRATARPDANQFAVYNLTSRVTAGNTYAVSAWVFQTGAANDVVRLASKVGCSAGDTYPWLQNNAAVVPNTWTQLSGNLVIPAGCTVVDVVIFLEGTPIGADVFVDDVSVTAP
ncbi:MAG TPA: endo-1,4-beta-xylanase [Steroidobacteraceae bacterium]|nr:endo-1,4-beta-xylanase [Steroidobacteraceae bacterium]